MARHFVRTGPVFVHFAPAGPLLGASARAGPLPVHFVRAGPFGAFAWAALVLADLAQPVLGHLVLAVRA